MFYLWAVRIMIFFQTIILHSADSRFHIVAIVTWLAYYLWIVLQANVPCMGRPLATSLHYNIMAIQLFQSVLIGQVQLQFDSYTYTYLI